MARSTPCINKVVKKQFTRSLSLERVFIRSEDGEEEITEFMDFEVQLPINPSPK